MEVRLLGVKGSHGGACCFAMKFLPSSSSHLSFCSNITHPLPFMSPLKQAMPRQQHAITALIKWQKDPILDAVIQREKKLKRVTKIKDLLVQEPGMCLSLRELGKHRKMLKLTKQRRLITFLERFPTIFDIFEEGVSNTYFRLTPAAEDLFLEEQKLRNNMEDVLVCKIRKLLMMSVDNTLLIFKLAHLKKDLGLPDDFKTNLVEKHPEFFKVIQLQAGPALELTSWDPALAISAWEKKFLTEPLEDGVLRSHARYMPRFKFPGSRLMKGKDKAKIKRFENMSYVSPYSDFAHLDPASKEAEKHACAVVHELLSITIEKRVNIDFLTHFRKDYNFSQQVYGMLVRHPELFYVSLKGDRHSVFLREAYEGSQLIDKEPLTIVKEKLMTLIEQGDEEVKQHKNAGKVDGEEEDEEEYSGSDHEVVTDLSVENDEGLTERLQPTQQSPERKERVIRRPLVILEREEKAMAELISCTRERW